VGNASGISRGDRNRNALLGRLRQLVPFENAIVGVDLADKKQMVVVCDHDSRVLLAARSGAGRGTSGRRWTGPQRAAARGFAGVTVACEPTGHRWRVLGQLAADRGMSLVCVETLQTAWGAAQRGPDLRQDRRQGRGADRSADRAAALPSTS
jgi:transposase